MLGKDFRWSQVRRHLVPGPGPPRAAEHNVRAPISAPTGHSLLKEKTGRVASVLAKAEESFHFSRCAAFGKHKARKDDEIDSALRLLSHVAKDRPKFVELLGGDH
jgi:hypothetical protein